MFKGRVARFIWRDSKKGQDMPREAVKGDIHCKHTVARCDSSSEWSLSRVHNLFLHIIRYHDHLEPGFVAGDGYIYYM